MAGAFTHFIVCDVAKRKRSIADSEMRRLLNKHSEFLFLGAASPDLPYLSFKTGHINWADVMHYENTNGIAINGHFGNGSQIGFNPVRFGRGSYM